MSGVTRLKLVGSAYKAGKTCMDLLINMSRDYTCRFMYEVQQPDSIWPSLPGSALATQLPI